MAAFALFQPFGSVFSEAKPQLPLVETNPNGEWRPAFIKMRQMKGKTASIIRTLARTTSESELEAAIMTAHWGLQVGPYLYEITTDRKKQKTLALARLTGAQIWESDVGEHFIGTTSSTDEEINYQGT